MGSRFVRGPVERTQRVEKHVEVALLVRHARSQQVLERRTMHPSKPLMDSLFLQIEQEGLFQTEGLRAIAPCLSVLLGGTEEGLHSAAA